MLIRSNRVFGARRRSRSRQAAGALLLGLLLWLTIPGCETPEATITAPATTSPAGPAVPATAPVGDGLQAAVRAYRDAFQARDRETMREMVFLPSDPQRRQWVLDTLDKGLFPPPGAKMLAIDVKMDGPVAVCEGKLQMADGSVEAGGPMFFVQRNGRWYFVIDMFEGADLTLEEMDVINRHMMGEDEDDEGK